MLGVGTRWIRLLMVLGLVWGLVWWGAPPDPVEAASGTVSGVVFDDVDVSGVKGGSEPGVAGALVRAFDATGSLVGTATSAANGSYSITVANAETTDIRIEFTVPTGYQSSFAMATGSTVQFVSIGATTVDLGVHRPDFYCQANPSTACSLVEDTVGTFASLRSFNWDNTGADNNIATNSETGAIWGLAWQRQTGTLFSAPTIRRNTKIYESPAGTPRPGQIFMSTTSAGSTVPYVDVSALGIDVGTVPNWATRTTAVNNVIDGFAPNGTWDLTGKVGIGDIDVSLDGQTLWFVNLHDRKLYGIDIGTPLTSGSALTSADVSGFTPPNPNCVNGVYRPWAVSTHRDGSVFIGGVCTAENGGSRANLEAVVYRFDPAAETFGSTPVLRFPLNYTKGNAHVSAFEDSNKQWNPWWEIPNQSNEWWRNGKGAMPILSDIEFTDDGSMTLGFLDRMGQRAQTWNSRNARLPGYSSLNDWYWSAGGDILRACTADQQTWQIEPLQPTITSRSCIIGGVTYFTGTSHAGQQSGEYEFYNDTVVDYSYQDFGGGFIYRSGHLEGAVGGLATYPRATHVASTIYDPNQKFFNGGVRWLANSNGAKRGTSTTGDRELVSESDGQSFGKAGGAGDLEVLCDMAPLQIGNRIWNDIDGDGVQDPGEPGIANVMVSLYDAADILVATVTTDANGTYRFSTGDGLQPFTDYEIRLDDPSNFGTGPIAQLYPSDADQLSPEPTDANDAIDSDAMLSSGTSYGVDRFPVIVVPALDPGHNDHTFDFGFTDPQARVGDRVWHDLDRDGVQDPGEPGIAGVSLTITNADGSAVFDIDGNPVTTTTTDSDGDYVFENLPAGEYVVTVSPPTGYTASTPTVDTSPPLAVGDEDLTLDFGFYTPTVSVGDRVWFDTDQDGVQDSGEAGFANVIVSITKPDGTPALDVTGMVVASTTTSASGEFSFDLLPPGEYRITITTPAGLLATTPTTVQSTLLSADGASDRTLDFGLFAPSVSVGDRVWFDTNQDGVQDADESGIAGVTLTITKADGSAAVDVFGNPVSTTTTGTDGNYLFTDLPIGDYKVTVTAPVGLIPTEPNATAGSTTSAVMTLDGEADLTLDFGFVAPMVSVGDRVWIDTDADGVQDAGELGIAGVTLTITKADGSAVVDVFGNPVTTTTTDANGNYSFDDLPLGQYKVTVVAPTGYAPSGTNAVNGHATSLSLSADGAEDLTLDFGYAPSVSVGDRVWFDANQDGVQDAGEVGIAGVTLTITKADGTPAIDVFGNPVTTTTTDANGNYSFDDLPFGEYMVAVTAPSGVVASTPTSLASVALSTNGDADLTLDFGFYAPSVSVGDRVWFDANQDGVQDGDEVGIPGVMLTITKADGTPAIDVFGNQLSTVTTSASGDYLFGPLPFGEYEVTVTPPVGYTASGTNAVTGSAVSRSLITDGDADLTLDFGYYAPVVIIGGTLWTDDDGDGNMNGSELGIAGLTVWITDVSGSAVTDIFGQPVTSTTTDATGQYTFDLLPPGQYTITTTIPAGRSATTPTTVTSLVLTAGQSDMTLNIGMTSPPPSSQPFVPSFVAPSQRMSIVDRVWFDANRNCAQDAEERGIAGVRVTLTRADGSPVIDASGRPVTAVVTDENGAYSFIDLPWDDYRVTIDTSPVHTASTLSILRTSSLQPQATECASAFALFAPRTTVSGNLWLDADRDGVRGWVEAGLSGVQVMLSNRDGSPVFDVFGRPILPVFTDTDGNYVFENLPPGSYVVTVVPPFGMVLTNADSADRSGRVVPDQLTNDGDRADRVDLGLAPAPRLPVTGSGDQLAVAALWLLVFGLLAEVARRRLVEPYRPG